MADRLPFDALVFDVGGVFIPHDNEVLYQRLAGRCTAPNALDRIREKALDPHIGTGETSIAMLHQALVAELSYAEDWNGFLAAWSSHLALDAEMLALIQDLAKANRVLLFSNTNREHWDCVMKLTHSAIAELETYLSFEIGQIKPSLASFRTVVSRAGIDASRFLFVDDRPENVAAARQIGFDGHVFVDRARLERYLKSRSRH